MREIDSFSEERVESIDRISNPYSYEGSSDIDTIKCFTESYKDEEDINDDVWTLSGRIRRENDFGDFVFYDISDGTGTVQIMCSVDERLDFNTEDYERLKDVNIGDRVVFCGCPEFSDTGELTLEAREFSVTSKSLQEISKSHNQFGESTKITDRTGALTADDELFSNIQTRFEVTSTIREYLNNRGFNEVQTPILQNQYGGAEATPFVTHTESINKDMYLRISPELYLKRLVTAGFSPIYEVAKCFRNEDIDTTHNPEFTLLELYKSYADYNDMMDLTEQIYSYVSEEVRGESCVEIDGSKTDITPPWNRYTFDELLENRLGYNPRDASTEKIRSEVQRNSDVKEVEDMNRDDLLMEIFDTKVEESLTEPTIVKRFPKGSTPLCKVCEDDESRLQRFEAYIGGLEVANAYTELTNPQLQKQRFLSQSKNINEEFVEAVSYGMPPTGGLGLGIDRMCMLISGCGSIKDILPFPIANRRV